MRKVYKYDLNVNTALHLPNKAKVLCAKEQYGKVCLWAEVNPVAPLEPRHFRMYATGEPMTEENSTFIDTVLLHGGGLVLHVYEVHHD